MKVKRWIQVLAIGCGILALAACTTKHNRATDQAAINSANSAYSGARASGIGGESGFGGARGERISSKRVYYFDYDSNVVHDQDKPAIVANSEHLVSNPNNKVMLEGHTDPRGSREYNIGLGERRAKAVANIMTSKGVNPSQIRVVSYGAEKLASNGHSPADYQLDRRAVLVNMQR